MKQVPKELYNDILFVESEPTDKNYSERLLLDSVLRLAITDLITSANFNDSYSWIMRESEDPFSFNFVCVELGLDPAGVRERINHWLESGNLSDSFKVRRGRRRTG